eukprot:scaffold151316_cov71-Cyclotella_meneghiniana.AAC.2
MNAPERSSAFILEDDEEKIEYAADTKVSNAGTFTLNKEDHTMANLLRLQLLRDPQVTDAIEKWKRENDTELDLKSVHKSVDSIVQTSFQLLSRLFC